jgi:hypothetical protein
MYIDYYSLINPPRSLFTPQMYYFFKISYHPNPNPIVAE